MSSVVVTTRSSSVLNPCVNSSKVVKCSLKASNVSLCSFPSWGRRICTWAQADAQSTDPLVENKEADVEDETVLDQISHQGVIEPIEDAEEQCWFKGLSEKYVSKLSSNNQNSSHNQNPKSFPPLILHLTTSAILFTTLLANSRALAQLKPLPDLRSQISLHNTTTEDENEEISDSNSANTAEDSDIVENVEDLELKAALESWKSKTFALTVPLRIVALRGSIPPSWIKEFVSSQGRRLKFQTEFRGSLNDIFKELCSCVSKGNVVAKSAMAADVITVGDSWLKNGIVEGVIEPIEDAEEQFWFKGLCEKWKVHLRRDDKGELDPGGKLWAVPYRWGTMVIAYKTNKFRNYNMAPIEDWSDLWRPELAGKISMVNSPREIIGSVLKYMGASYNTKDIDRQVTGGMKAVMQNLMLLQKQVKLFDSVHYLKAFGVGDVWVVVGWSNDVLPIVKRMSDVAVIVPKSGASLWADLWAIPAACKFETSGIGGRSRGPSPLIHQWIEFCLGEARALPFKQEVVPGASPIEFEEAPAKEIGQLTKGRPKLNTNLIGGAPPQEILAKCEFLEPLPESVIKDYSLLIDAMQKPGRGLVFQLQDYMSLAIQKFGLKTS